MTFQHGFVETASTVNSYALSAASLENLREKTRRLVPVTSFIMGI